MRKSDYAALAAIIKEQTKLHSSAKNGAEWERANQSKLCAIRIARNFADKASVNPAEFLKACGID